MITFCTKMLSDIKKNNPNLKMIGLNSLVDGAVGLFRNSDDGNAYEIEIRPVSEGHYKDLWGDLIKNRLERSSFKPNKNEVLSFKDVIDIIKSSFPNIIKSIKLVKNNNEFYTFRVYFVLNTNLNDTKEGIKHLKSFEYFSVSDQLLSDINGNYLKIYYKKL